MTILSVPPGHFHAGEAAQTGTTDNSIRPQDSTMLMLPDGTVLYCHIEEGNLFYSQFGSQLYVYIPIGPQVESGAPVINSITPNADGSFHLTGTGLTGISEGAAFGDDAQMACNYPLITFHDTNNNHVDYARTYNWTSTGVRTGHGHHPIRTPGGVDSPDVSGNRERRRARLGPSRVFLRDAFDPVVVSGGQRVAECYHGSKAPNSRCHRD